MRAISVPLRALVVVGVLLAASPSPCRADSPSDWQFRQFLPSGMFGFAEQRGFRPPIGERDLTAIAEALGLDESQREALLDLHRSLIAEFKAAWVAHKESVLDAQLEAEAESGNQNDWSAQMIAQMDQREKFQKLQDDLVESLFSDLRLLLTPAQEVRWPSVERDRRRATTISAFALHDEEALDLVSLVHAMDLTPAQRTTLTPILDRYADQLDSLLGARNRAAQSLGEKAAAYYRDEQGSQSLWRTNPEKAQQWMMEQTTRQEALVPEALALRDACDKVRDLNIATVRELEPLIPDAATEDWDKAVHAKRTSPMSAFFSTSRASMAIRTIENLEAQTTALSTMFGEGTEAMDVMRIFRSAEPLTTDQRKEIEDLRERHETRLDAVKARHAPVKSAPDAAPATLNLQTPQGTVVIHRIDAQDEDNSFGFMGMDQPSPEMTKELRALDLETIHELRELLTLNQRAAICMW